MQVVISLNPCPKLSMGDRSEDTLLLVAAILMLIILQSERKKTGQHNFGVQDINN